MHSYTVHSAIYDGSSVNQDPLVTVSGTMDGQPVFDGRAVFWSAIQRAFAVGGIAGVQALLAPILLGVVAGPPFQALPHIDGQIAIPAPVTLNGGTGSTATVICTQALVPPWVA